MITHVRLLLLLLVTGLFNLSYAQTDAKVNNEIKKLTLEESLKLGLQNSNFLHSSKMKVLNADARLSELSAMKLPSLKLNAAYTRLSKVPPFAINTPFGDFVLAPDIANTYNVKLSLQQPIFTGFRLSGSSDFAENSLNAQKQEYNRDEQELIFNIKNAYWSLYKAIKFKEVIDENVNQIKAHLKDVNNLSDQGMATRNDVLKVQVQLAEAQLRQIDGTNAVRLSRLNLANIIGLPLKDNIDISEELNPKVESITDVELFINKAYENRPELKSLDFRVKAGENGITIAKSGWWPQVFLTGNYYYSRPNQRYFPSKDEFKDSWDVSLGLSFDIWNWGQTSDQTAQAETQLEQIKDTYKIVKDNITLEVTQNYLSILQAQEKMMVSENSVTQAEENYRITNEKFKNGLVLNSELLDAEVALLQSRTNYVQSLVDYEISKARLEKSSGQSTEYKF